MVSLGCGVWGPGVSSSPRCLPDGLQDWPVRPEVQWCLSKAPAPRPGLLAGAASHLGTWQGHRKERPRRAWGRAWARPWERAPGPAAPSLDRATRPAGPQGLCCPQQAWWAVGSQERVGGTWELACGWATPHTLSQTPVLPDSCNSVLGRLGPLPHLPCPHPASGRCVGAGVVGKRLWRSGAATQTLREEGH